ncbi:MAG TPA: MBOAT family O-acyltransferase [Pseudomonadales bacterium]
MAGRLSGHRAALTWTCLASLVFYLSWNPAHAWVLAATLSFNYWLSKQLIQPDFPARRALMVIGVITNAAFLAVFKVMAGGIWDASGGFSASTQILIPLAISFITFQQIAFVVDVYKRRIKTLNWLDYLAFILFFPQLVMGPIVHYRDMAPQFHRSQLIRWSTDNFSVGLAIFIVGLFKKLVIADSIAPYVNDSFTDTSTLSLLDAWTVIIGFQMQLYFDFSGYADMAIGIARMLNIQLPINFDSPYKSTNRFEQWRRWHISFSVFMRQYIFFPLARNRWLPMNATQALFMVAVFSGFWHGFGSTFMLWGIAQAVIMLLIHWRRHLIQQLPLRIQSFKIALPIQVFATFWVTLMLCVLFRSPDITSAKHLYQSLFNANGLYLPFGWDARYTLYEWTGIASRHGDILVNSALGGWLLLAAFITWCMPNTQQVFSNHWTAMDQRHESIKDTWSGFIPYLDRRVRFRPNAGWAIALGLLLAACIACMDRSSRFIYYQF